MDVGLSSRLGEEPGPLVQPQVFLLHPVAVVVDRSPSCVICSRCKQVARRGLASGGTKAGAPLSGQGEEHSAQCPRPPTH